MTKEIRQVKKERVAAAVVSGAVALPLDRWDLHCFQQHPEKKGQGI